jgi:ribosome-associated protein
MSQSEARSGRPRRTASAASRSSQPRATKARPPRADKSAADRAVAGKVPADVKAAVAAALSKKAIDPVVLDLRKGSAFTDFFVILTGANVRQVKAIADAVEEALRKRGTKPALVEGASRAEWILIDYFDFIVHVFTPATREFYALERLWGDAQVIEVGEK